MGSRFSHCSFPTAAFSVMYRTFHFKHLVNCFNQEWQLPTGAEAIKPSHKKLSPYLKSLYPSQVMPHSTIPHSFQMGLVTDEGTTPCKWEWRPRVVFKNELAVICWGGSGAWWQKQNREGKKDCTWKFPAITLLIARRREWDRTSCWLDFCHWKCVGYIWKVLLS